MQILPKELSGSTLGEGQEWSVEGGYTKVELNAALEVNGSKISQSKNSKRETRT